jgi:cysteine desulfurase
MIYFDNNATTFLDPEVFAEMQPLMQQFVGNPSSIHHYGQRAKGILLESQKKCAVFFDVRGDEVYFTSGATEALNLLINSVPKGKHVITSSLEHAAVIEPLKASGLSVTYLDPPLRRGAVDPSQVQASIQANTHLILLSGANNETGIKTDLETIGLIAEEAGIAFAVDGVALLGKDIFSLPRGVTAACFSGHKIHGPLGAGLLIAKKRWKLHPLIRGGTQQRGLRAGTENLPAIVGFTKALDLFNQTIVTRMTHLRERFENGILANLPDCFVHGQNEPRVSNTSNIAFLGVDGETLLMALDLAGLAASHGSACSSGTLGPSRVLLSMGVPAAVARASLRFSFSRFTTTEEIDQSISLITKVVNRLRE